MKYPYIIFYRLDKFSDIDNFFIENNKKLNCTIFFTGDKNVLTKMFDSNYQILITYGDSEEEYINNVMSIITERMRDRWVHLTKINSIEEFNRIVNFCFIYNCTYEREHVRPIFSVFTPAYNSYHKIKRAYNSLKNQTLKDWEFIVLDDSPTDDHFEFLRSLMINDPRVRLYRKGENNGNIGNLKNEAVSLCRGKYLLEFDHDDEILPFVLQDAANYFDKNEDVGFIYMDCIALYENGQNFWYGDFICKGYGSYYCQKYNGKWVFVYNTPNINNITLSHLVCCPNHPRIWRKSALTKAGNYSEFLPICDDYEIILRTALTTKIAKIHKLGYIQYMNDNNNNFSIIRNSEINRIGPEVISPMFYDVFKINEKMKNIDAYENEDYIYNHSKIWKRDNSYEHKYCNKIVNVDYSKHYCIVGIDSLLLNIELINSLYTDFKNDFFIIDNKCTIDHLQFLLDIYGFSRFKCYTLIDETPETLIRYFLLQYKSCENYEIINNYINKIKYNTKLNDRHSVINSVSTPDNKYLEIGVETGFTFNNTHFIDKTGVDPSPTFKSEQLVEKTADEFFESLETDIKYDIVFIDGMHQSEYVLNDLNNSIFCLNKNGKIIIDDIIPLNVDEQLKIPLKHTYENGILKTLIPWTGDVWKVLFHVLTFYSEYITFEYYYNLNYRGIAVLQIKEKFNIPNTDIEQINSYDYKNDFLKYMDLIINREKNEDAS
jgi:glycosyltransferase involved in cell wall biosynthesis